MAYVIAEPCVDVLDQSCVAVCPVDCIHFEEGTDRKLFIDPDECITAGHTSIHVSGVVAESSRGYSPAPEPACAEQPRGGP